MKKSVLVSLITLVVIVAVAIIIWRVVDNNRTNMNDIPNGNFVGNDSDENVSNPNQPEGKKMAFGDFVAQGGSYECNVDQYIDGDYSSAVQGKVFIANNMIRGNYDIQAGGMDIDASVIVRDGFAYTWTDAAPIGYKIAADASGAGAQGSAAGTYSWNADQIGDYQCEPWNADASVFVVPSNITFQAVAS